MNRSGALRVSDWSGTPQRGNPREEYSGKRDPAAFEPGHAQMNPSWHFHPLEERFEVQTPIIQKDKLWLPDISVFFSSGFSLIKLNKVYTAANPGADPEVVERSLGQLANLAKRQIGVIELNADLDIETVTEIFIRINSKGVVLSQADFAMSKIASNETHGGPLLRKAIDYFCHLCKEPQYYDHWRVPRRTSLRRHRRFAPTLRAHGSRAAIRRCSSVGDFVPVSAFVAPWLTTR